MIPIYLEDGLMVTNNQNIPGTALCWLWFGTEARFLQRRTTLILATSCGKCDTGARAWNVLASPEPGPGTTLDRRPEERSEIRSGFCSGADILTINSYLTRFPKTQKDVIFYANVQIGDADWPWGVIVVLFLPCTGLWRSICKNKSFHQSNFWMSHQSIPSPHILTGFKHTSANIRVSKCPNKLSF